MNLCCIILPYFEKTVVDHIFRLKIHNFSAHKIENHPGKKPKICRWFVNLTMENSNYNL